jgi:hypothetical protein
MVAVLSRRVLATVILRDYNRGGRTRDLSGHQPANTAPAAALSSLASGNFRDVEVRACSPLPAASWTQKGCCPRSSCNWMSCFQHASYVFHVPWVCSSECMRQTCLRAGEGWGCGLTVYCMLAPSLFTSHISVSTKTPDGIAKPAPADLRDQSHGLAVPWPPVMA